MAFTPCHGPWRLATLPVAGPARSADAALPARATSAPGTGVLTGSALAVAFVASRSVRRKSSLRSRLEKRIIRESPFPDEKPVEGDIVRIHYVAKLSDGTCFDSSRARKKPFEFVLGESEVIDGWEVLVKNMALSEKAELICPPEYAYGEQGVPPYVPPSETVHFRVELLDIGRLVEDKADVVDVVEDEEEEEEEEENFWDKDELELRERGRCQGFTWEASGSGREVLVRVPLADDVRVKSINVDITSTSVKCRIGDEVIVEGTLFAPVLTDDSFWDLEKRGKKAFLLITLGKLDSSHRWDSLLEGGDPGSPSDAAPEVEVMNMDEVLAEIRGAKSAT